MTTERHQLLYESPEGEVIGLDEVQLLDPIPERVAPLRAMLSGPDQYDAYQAALILAAWGDEAGARYLLDFVLVERPGELPVEPHRIRASDDEAPDSAAEALHLYGSASGDVHTRDEGYRRCLELFGRISFSGKLQSVLRRDHPSALLDVTREAYERTAARGDAAAAATLLPALVAMSDPDSLRLIADRADVIRGDTGIQRGLREAASELRRTDVETLVARIALSG
jgi:hypothetical protein